MPRSARAVKAALKQKGFDKKENDHTYFHLMVGGKKTPIFTKISHGEKEIGDKLLGLMARQLRLSAKQFRNLVDCPLSAEGLIEHLRAGQNIE